MYFLNNFIIYSIIGFIMESTIYKFKDASRHSGILFGPYTLVYGVGVVTVLLIYKFFERIKINKILKIILMFISFVIFLTLIEWIGGNVIYQIFNIDLWDYTKHEWNLGKYISLPIALGWGILGLMVVYIFKPMSDRLIKIIPKWFSLISFSIILIDAVLTLILKGV